MNDNLIGNYSLEEKIQTVQLLLNHSKCRFIKQPDSSPSYGFSILWQETYSCNRLRLYLRIYIFKKAFLPMNMLKRL